MKPFFAPLPQETENAILENIFSGGPAVHDLMPYQASPEGRLCGMEFEFASLSENTAYCLFSRAGTKRAWTVHHDCSIPSIEAGSCYDCGGSGEVFQECRWCTHGQHEYYCRLTPCECEGEAPCTPGEGCQECSCECSCESFECESCSGSGMETVGGCEVVSPPGKSEEFFEKAREIFNMAMFAGARAAAPGSDAHGDEHHSTGYHVHVDARDLTKAQCAAVAVIFRNSWDVLANEHPEVLPEFRRDGYWCRELSSSCRTLQQVWDNLQYCRYQAVNLCALQRHKTVEFRAGFLPNTGEQAIAWAKRVRQLVANVSKQDLTMDMPVEEITESFAPVGPVQGLTFSLEGPIQVWKYEKAQREQKALRDLQDATRALSEEIGNLEYQWRREAPLNAYLPRTLHTCGCCRANYLPYAGCRTHNGMTTESILTSMRAHRDILVETLQAFALPA